MDTKKILNYASQVLYGSTTLQDGSHLIYFHTTHKNKFISSDTVAGCVSKMLQLDIREDVRKALLGRTNQK